MNVKINIKAIIWWERMTGRSFMCCDLSCEQDLSVLLYCVTVSTARTPFVYDKFKALLANKKIIKKLTDTLDVYTAFTGQFMRTFEPTVTSYEVCEVTIQSVAARLIIEGGMDANYVMYQMGLEDLPMYITALSERKQQEEESRRLWTFYNILPHIDSKKLSEPAKLHVFPWEAEANIRQAQDDIERNEDKLRKFLAGEMVDFNTINTIKNTNYE